MAVGLKLFGYLRRLLLRHWGNPEFKGLGQNKLGKSLKKSIPIHLNTY